MAASYREIVVGSTGYTGAPAGGAQMLTTWEPSFHSYRVVAGTSGADVMISFDGINDHLRVPFAPSETGGIVNPIDLPVSYKNVWVRQAAGVTGTIGIGFFTRQ